eukprot:3708324-Pleurochrysis_carterae.AAC.1
MAGGLGAARSKHGRGPAEPSRAVGERTARHDAGGLAHAASAGTGGVLARADRGHGGGRRGDSGARQEAG